MKKISNKLKNKLNIIILIIVTILVLYISLKDNFYDVIIGFSKMNVLWIIIALILVFGYYSLRALSLYNFVIKFKKTYKYKDILRIVFITQFFDGITPSSTGGQPYQMYIFNKNGIKISDCTTIVIQNFIVYQIALILLGFIAVISNKYLNLFQEVGAIKKLILLGFAINVLVMIALFSLAFLKKINKTIINFIINILSKLRIIKDKEEKTKKINEYIEQFHDSTKIMLKDKKVFLKTILFNFLSLTLIYSIPAILIFGLGNYNDVNIFYSIIASAYVMLIGSFVPIPGAAGGLEYAFTQFYGVFISGPVLTLVMLLWRAATYYLGVIIGAILLNLRKKR